jgi:hypothetical protein
VAAIEKMDGPIKMRALVNPSCALLNHTDVVLGTIPGKMAAVIPNKNDVTAMPAKLTENPRSAENIPARMQIAVSVRFMPKRSTSKPPGRPTKIPASGSSPQIAPTETSSGSGL